MKLRPFGFALLAGIFVWFTIAAIWNAALQFSREGPAYSPILGALALGAAVAASFSAYGLWHALGWVVTSLRLWMVACALLLLWRPFSAFVGLESFPPILQLVPIVSFIALISVLFLLLDRFVTRRVRPAA
jgi:hypothetical protein